MASSVDMLDQYVNCIGSRLRSSDEQINGLTSCSKHFMMTECYRAIIVHAGDLGVFGHRDDGGPLEASGEYRTLL